MAVGRRIEDQTLILIAAAGLPLYELERIFHHPADIALAAELHVALGPGHHLTDRIQMSHIGTGYTGCQRSCASVGKEVQHLRHGSLRSGCSLHQAGSIGIDEFPVRSLLGEHAYMLERSEAETQIELRTLRRAFITDYPLFRHLAQHDPGAAVLLAGLAETGARLEFSLSHTPPLGIRKTLAPERLGLRADGIIVAEPLQLRKVAGVDQFVVFPLCRWLFDVH